MKKKALLNILKSKPHLLFFCGDLGKSMAKHRFKGVLRAAGKEFVETENIKHVGNALIAPNGSWVLVKSVFMAFVAPKREGLHLLECSPLADHWQEMILKQAENIVVVIPFIAAKNASSVSRLKQYVKQICPVVDNKFATVIYNADIENMTEVMQEQVRAENTIGVSLAEGGNVRAEYVEYGYEQEGVHKRVKGMNGKFAAGGSAIPFRVLGGLGQAHIYATLFAGALAKHTGINMIEALNALRDQNLLPGRLRIIPGIKKTTLVDDSYEISFDSARATFADSAKVETEKGGRKVAVLCDIEHIGKETTKKHMELGEELAYSGYTLVVGVGEKTSALLRAVQAANVATAHFQDPAEAAKFLQQHLRPYDLVVIKGARQWRFEIIVKELMAFPLEAGKMLISR